jgi:DNA topoisomerase-3
METVGRQVTDEKAREAMMESGLGTPATRAGIIETLLHREYIERSAKSLIPTKRGLALYESVRNLRIADVELTGTWEKSLSGIEKGTMKPETFMKEIVIYTKQITAEVLSLDVKQPQGEVIPCPKCGNGRMTIRHKIAKCDNDKCGLVVYRRFLNKELTDQHIGQLLKHRKTRLIKGFEGKAGKTFDACLAFDKNFNLTFKFPNDKSKIPNKAAKPVPKDAAMTKPGTKPKSAKSKPTDSAAPKSGAKPKPAPKSGAGPKVAPASKPKPMPNPKGKPGSGSESV